MEARITSIVQIGRYEGESVTVRGWLYNIRESGKLLFPQFRDGMPQQIRFKQQHDVTADSFVGVLLVIARAHFDFALS